MIKAIVQGVFNRLGYRIERVPASSALEYSAVTHDPEGPFDYEGTIRFLVGLNVTTEDHIRQGSIPQPSLHYLEKFFRQYFPGASPLTALHIGNFLGVSLTWAAHCLRQLHRDSVVVSMDPNLAHRGVQNPLNVVIKIANHLSLQRNIMFLVGYSLERTWTNQGLEGVYDSGPAKSSHLEMAFENTLQNLQVFSEGKFDIALIDGYHESSYLKREITHAYHLLRNGGLVVLDDLDDYWQQRAGLRECYDKVDEQMFVKEGTNGRVGILRKKSPSQTDQV